MSVEIRPCTHTCQWKIGPARAHVSAWVDKTSSKEVMGQGLQAGILQACILPACVLQACVLQACILQACVLQACILQECVLQACILLAGWMECAAGVTVGRGKAPAPLAVASLCDGAKFLGIAKPEGACKKVPEVACPRRCPRLHAQEGAQLSHPGEHLTLLLFPCSSFSLCPLLCPATLAQSIGEVLGKSVCIT